MNYKELDKWWATEPFGWDHPDTYNSIKELIKSERVRTLEEIIEMLDEKDCVASAGYMFKADFIDEIKKRFEAKDE